LPVGVALDLEQFSCFLGSGLVIAAVFESSNESNANKLDISDEAFGAVAPWSPSLIPKGHSNLQLNVCLQGLRFSNRFLPPPLVPLLAENFVFPLPLGLQ
jgi:hypothetical protein